MSAPPYAQVKFWVGEFKRGRTSLEDETGLDAYQMPPMKNCVTKYEIWCTLRIKVEEIANAHFTWERSIKFT